MVVLASESSLNEIGIDTYKRAIVYAVFLLRRGYLKSSDISLKNSFTVQPQVQIEEDGNVLANLIVNAKLKHTLSLLETSGDFINSVIPENESVSYVGGKIEPSSDGLALIQSRPLFVSNLEQYFLWAFFEYQKYILVNNLREKKRDVNLSANFDGTLDYQVADYTVQIPFDYCKFLKKRNYLAAIGYELITSSEEFDLNSYLITNSTYVVNDGLIFQEV